MTAIFLRGVVHDPEAVFFKVANAVQRGPPMRRAKDRLKDPSVVVFATMSLP